MTFLALSAQKSLFTLQKSQLVFEQTLVLNQVNWCQKQMQMVAQEYANRYGDDPNAPSYDEDQYYLKVKQMDDELQTRQQTLNDQITLMNEEINSTKTLVNNNIKSGCGLNLLGG